MSHIIKLYWAILDKNGNSVDGIMYNSENEANDAMVKMSIANAGSIILTVKQQELIIA